MCQSAVRLLFFLCLFFNLQETIGASTAATSPKTTVELSPPPIVGDHEAGNDDERDYWKHVDRVRGDMIEKEGFFLSVLEKVKNAMFDETETYAKMEKSVLAFLRICKEDTPEKYAEEPSYASFLTSYTFMRKLAAEGSSLLSPDADEEQVRAGAFILIQVYDNIATEVLRQYIILNDVRDASILIRAGISIAGKARTNLIRRQITDRTFARRKKEVISEQPDNFLKLEMERGYSLMEYAHVQGEYLLSMAVAMGRTEIAKLLLSNGHAFDKNHVSEIAFCLHLLHTKAFSQFSELRLVFEAYTQTIDENGRNILMTAVSFNQIHAVLILREHVSESYRRKALEFVQDISPHAGGVALQPYPTSAGNCMDESSLPGRYDPSRIKDIFNENIEASRAIKDDTLRLNCFVDEKFFYSPIWHAQDSEWVWRKDGLEILYPNGFLEKYHATFAATDTEGRESETPTKKATTKEDTEEATKSGETWVRYSDIIKQFETQHGIIDISCETIIVEALHLSLSSYSTGTPSPYSHSPFSKAVSSLPDTSGLMRMLSTSPDSSSAEGITENMLIFSMIFANFASETSEESTKKLLKKRTKQFVIESLTRFTGLSDSDTLKMDINGMSSQLYRHLFFFIGLFDQEEMNEMLEIILKGNLNFFFLNTLIFKLNSMNVIQEMQMKRPELHTNIFEFGLGYKCLCLLEEIIDKNEEGFVDHVGENIDLKELFILPTSDVVAREFNAHHRDAIMTRIDASTRNHYEHDAIVSLVVHTEDYIKKSDARLTLLDYALAIFDVIMVRFLGRKGASSFSLGFEHLFRIGAPFVASTSDRGFAKPDNKSKDALILDTVSVLLSHESIAGHFFKIDTRFFDRLPGLQESLVAFKAVEKWLMIVLLNIQDYSRNVDNLRRVRHLRKIGVDLDKSPFLHLAVLHGDIRVIENLLTTNEPKGNKVKLNMLDEKGETALDVAEDLLSKEKGKYQISKDRAQLLNVQDRKGVVDVLRSERAITSTKRAELLSEARACVASKKKNEERLDELRRKERKEQQSQSNRGRKKKGNKKKKTKKKGENSEEKELTHKIQELTENILRIALLTGLPSELENSIAEEPLRDNGQETKPVPEEMGERNIPDDMSMAERRLMRQYSSILEDLPGLYQAHEVTTACYSRLITKVTEGSGKDIDEIIDVFERRNTTREMEDIGTITFRDPKMAKLLRERLSVLTLFLKANERIFTHDSSEDKVKRTHLKNLLQQITAETKEAYLNFLKKPLIEPSNTQSAEPEPAGSSDETISSPLSASTSKSLSTVPSYEDISRKADVIFVLDSRINANIEEMDKLGVMSRGFENIFKSSTDGEPVILQTKLGAFKCFVGKKEFAEHLEICSQTEARGKALQELYIRKRQAYMNMYPLSLSKSESNSALFKLVLRNKVDELRHYIDTVGPLTGAGSEANGVLALTTAVKDDFVEIGKILFKKDKTLAKVYHDLTGEHLLCQKKDISIEFAKVILEHTDIYTSNIDGSNIISTCALHNREDLMALIISALRSKGSEEQLREMMNAQDIVGRPVLLSVQHPTILKLLLENGAAQSINYRTTIDKAIVLHRACEVGEVELVKILVEAGADVFAENFLGQTPLDMSQNNDELASILQLYMLEAPWPAPKIGGHGHELSSSTNAVTLSFSFQRFICAVFDDIFDNKASISGIRAVLKEEKKRNILKNVKCPNVLDSSDPQMTLPLLSLFALRNREMLIEIFLDYGFQDAIDVHNGSSALFLALNNKHENIVENLLSRDIPEEVIQAKYERFTPLHLASAHGFPKIVALLLKRGAHVNALDDEGYNALMFAVGIERDDTEQTRDIIKLLLDAGIDLSAEYPGNGTTALNHYCRLRESEVARLLIELGNSETVNVKDKYGRTPLIYAAGSGSSDLIQPLINKGANPKYMEIRDNQDGSINIFSPLSVAIQFESFAAAQILIENGVTSSDVLSVTGGPTVHTWLWVKLYEIFERTVAFNWSRVADDAEEENSTEDEHIPEDLSGFDDYHDPEFVRYYGEDASDKLSGTVTKFKTSFRDKSEASFRGRTAAGGDGAGQYSTVESAADLSDIKRTLFVYESVEKWRRNPRNEHLLERFAKHLSYISTGEVRAGYKTLSGFTGVLGNKLWEAPLTGKQRILFEFPEILSDGSISPGHIWGVTIGHDGGHGIAKHALKLASNPHLRKQALDRMAKEGKLQATVDASKPDFSLITKTYGKGEQRKYELNSYHRGIIDWKAQLDEKDWNMYQELSDEELSYVKKPGFLELIGPPGTGKTDIMRFRMILNANNAVGQDHFLKLKKCKSARQACRDKQGISVASHDDGGAEMDEVAETADGEGQPEPDAEEHHHRIRQVFLAKSFNLCARVRRQMPDVYLDDKLTSMMFLPVSPSAGEQSRGVLASSFIEYIEEQASGEMSPTIRNARKYLQYEMFEKRYKSHAKATRRHTTTVLQGECALSAEIVWTQIQMNIKGSLLSFQNGRPLTRDEYIKQNTSKRSAQFTPEQKANIYKVFMRYEAFKFSEGFDSEKDGALIWHDEMDRVIDIIRRLKVHKEHFPFVRVHGTNKMWKGGRHPFDFIFIDEVQDLPPIIIALARTIVGGNPDAISVAGDLAQQITPGVAFDFKYVHDIIALDDHAQRTIGFTSLSKQGQSRILFTNYRTHEKNLKATNLILRVLQEHFQLPVARTDISAVTNRTGPTPKVWSTNTRELIDELSPGNTMLFRNQESIERFFTELEHKVNELKETVDSLNARRGREKVTQEYYDKEIKPLTADLEARTARLEKAKNYPTLTILEAKGLDFKRVVLVNFFSYADAKYCKLFRSIFQGHDIEEVIREDPGLLDGARNEFRLLYVAMTRSITELYIVETLENECQKQAFQFLTRATNSSESAEKLFQSYAPTEEGPKGSLHTLRISSSELIRQGSYLMSMALEGSRRTEAANNYMAQAKKMFTLAKRQDLSDQVDRFLSCDSLPEDVDEETFLEYIENCLEAGLHGKLLDALKKKDFPYPKYFVDKVQDRIRMLK